MLLEDPFKCKGCMEEGPGHQQDIRGPFRPKTCGWRKRFESHPSIQGIHCNELRIDFGVDRKLIWYDVEIEQAWNSKNVGRSKLVWNLNRCGTRTLEFDV